MNESTTSINTGTPFRNDTWLHEPVFRLLASEHISIAPSLLTRLPARALLSLRFSRPTFHSTARVPPLPLSALCPPPQSESERRAIGRAKAKPAPFGVSPCLTDLFQPCRDRSKDETPVNNVFQRSKRNNGTVDFKLLGEIKLQKPQSS